MAKKTENNTPESRELTFCFRENKNDRYLQLRVQRIGNGYTLRAGSVPVFYPSLHALADAVATGLRELETREERTPKA